MYSKKQIKLILTLVLFIFGITGSILTYSEKFSILSFFYNKNNFSTFQTSELLKGQKITGNFKAKENSLGIVAVRFNTHTRINEDSVIFRIKQKGESFWYYKNSYKVDQFQPNSFFTFGFPVINNSKGKTYEFEIESVHGKSGNAIALSVIEPSFMAKHQFFDEKYTARYVIKKIINSFSNTDFIFHSIFYFLPLVFYILFVLLNLKFISKLRALLILNSIVIVLDIFNFINLHSSGALVFLILGFLTIQVRYYKIESRVLFSTVLLFFLFSPIFLLLNKDIIAERLIIWGILILFVSLIIEISKLNPPFKKINLK